MKIVGGPHDGLNVIVNEALGGIKLWNYDPDVWRYCYAGEPTKSNIEWTYYTIRSVDCDDGPFIQFLVPADMSARQAFEFILERHTCHGGFLY